MRILNVHNRHVGAGGMEMMFESLSRLLRTRGHEVIEAEKDNNELRGLWAKASAFGSAIYSPAAKKAFSTLLHASQPDVVHIHNLYPQFSVSVLDACREAGFPVILHVQDYKITCPTAQHIRNGKLCTKCTGGREHWCAIHNCRGSMPMSVAYALRNAYARGSGKIHDTVSLYLCCSHFVRKLIIDNGYPAERSVTVHNFYDLPPFEGKTGDGDYVAFVGRISPEKGLDTLLEAARLTGLPVKIAGDPSFMPGIVDRAPASVRFVGKLDRISMQSFLKNARMLVVPSIWWEAFGLVAAEAMSRELPVIASNTGGLPEVVEHNRTGLLVPPGDAAQLADAMQQLWNNPTRRRAMGLAGREKAEREYSTDAYHTSLMAAYARVTRRTHAVVPDGKNREQAA